MQFQSTIYSKNDVYKLIKGINKAAKDSSLPEERLKNVFDVWWEELDTKFKKFISTAKKGGRKNLSTDKTEDSSNEILEEILELTRTQQRLLRSPEELLPPNYLMHIINKPKRDKLIHPGAVRDLMSAIKELDILVLTAKGKNKRTVSLKKVKEITESLLSPAEYIQNRVQESRIPHSRSAFEDGDLF